MPHSCSPKPVMLWCIDVRGFVLISGIIDMHRASSDVYVLRLGALRAKHGYS